MRLSSRIAMPMIRDLLAEVRAATAADTSIDQTLAELFGYDAMNGQWRVSEYGSWQDTPAFTDSVDAALALMERVLPGWDAHIYRDDDDGGRYAAEMAYPPGTDIGDAGYFGTDGRGRTRPLAIVEGILASKQALLEALAAKAAPLPDTDTGGKS